MVTSLIKKLRIKHSPLYNFNPPFPCPTSDIFYFNSSVNCQYYVLNASFLNKRNNVGVDILLFLLNSDGTYSDPISIEPSSGLFTPVDINNYVGANFSTVVAFCIFQSCDRNLCNFNPQSERGYIQYSHSSGLSTLVHGNFEAVTLFDGKLCPSSSTTLLPRKFSLQYYNRVPFVTYFFTNPSSVVQNIRVFSNSKFITSFTLSPLGSKSISLSLQNLSFVSFLPMCRPIIIESNHSQTITDIFHS